MKVALDVFAILAIGAGVALWAGAGIELAFDASTAHIVELLGRQ